MKTRSSLPKKPTLTTVVSLMMSLHEELRTELKSELKDIRETVDFLKDNVLMKDEAATKAELADFKSDVISHIDHFVQLHKKQDLELVALSHHITRHEEVFHPKA